MQRKPTLDAKAPGRCDPADGTPVATHVEARDQLSVDVLIKRTVAAMVNAQAAPSAPTPEQLKQLADAGLEETEPFTDYQVQVLEDDQPPASALGFVAELSEEERQVLLQQLTDLGGGEGPAEPEAPPVLPAEPGEAPS